MPSPEQACAGEALGESYSTTTGVPFPTRP